MEDFKNSHKDGGIPMNISKWTHAGTILKMNALNYPDKLGWQDKSKEFTFKEWNETELDSYLIEITRDILGYKDENGEETVEMILDTAGQKGTGKWTGISALDLGIPLTLIGESVFARCLSAQKDLRVQASKVITGPKPEFNGDKV